ncbi:hypothetical protein B0H14DRAFT_3715504 [Mycena olivaceomarginata]|nr:hypothetical protein B0H14DRAFT_3715504 [Mycena olivaceomarginata]
MFSFPPLLEGDTSTHNWYQDLLDHSDCKGDTHVNCAVIWARPTRTLLDVLQQIQARAAEYWGTDFYPIPSAHLHLSTLELSHKHPVAHLRAVLHKIGAERLRQMTELPGSSGEKRYPCLVRPRIIFDGVAVAVGFVPHAADSWSYHHLRADMQRIAVASGVNINTCYTAATAHVTIGRFVGGADALIERIGREGMVQGWLDLVRTINAELDQEDVMWEVGKEKGLEVQAGTALSGILSAKNKDGIMDIAWSLKLPEEGRKVVTVDRFDAYLDDHPAERQSAKYSGLFTRASRGRRAAAPTTLVHENGPPQRSTSHATPPSFVLENQSFPIDGQPDSPNFDYNFTFTKTHRTCSILSPPFDSSFETYTDFGNRS